MNKEKQLRSDLWSARQALAYIRDKAEAVTVTRLHLGEIAKSGLIKSGGPLTIQEAVQDVTDAEDAHTDTQRLDWLESSGRLAKFSDGWNAWIHGNINMANSIADTARQAIDHAMDQEQNQKSEEVYGI